MFLRHHWDVLVVDDEVDVLSVTRLALKGLTAFGIPVKIHECSSKEQAIALLEARGGSGLGRGRFAVALVDVVMESQHAGLELCQFVREKLKNTAMQLIVRTGQAGSAPEREVADNLDISAYTSKLDATQDRLYVLVKNGIRQFQWSTSHQEMFDWSTQLVESSDSRAHLEAVLMALMGRPASESMQAHIAMFIDDRVVGVGDFHSPELAVDALRALEGAETRPVGDSTDLIGRRGQLVQLTLSPKAGLPGVRCVARTNYEPMPEHFMSSWVQVMRCVRALWVRTS